MGKKHVEDDLGKQTCVSDTSWEGGSIPAEIYVNGTLLLEREAMNKSIGMERSTIPELGSEDGFNCKGDFGQGLWMWLHKISFSKQGRDLKEEERKKEEGSIGRRNTNAAGIISPGPVRGGDDPVLLPRRRV